MLYCSLFFEVLHFFRLSATSHCIGALRLRLEFVLCPVILTPCILFRLYGPCSLVLSQERDSSAQTAQSCSHAQQHGSVRPSVRGEINVMHPSARRARATGAAAALQIFFVILESSSLPSQSGKNSTSLARGRCLSLSSPLLPSAGEIILLWPSSLNVKWTDCSTGSVSESHFFLST